MFCKKDKQRFVPTSPQEREGVVVTNVCVHVASITLLLLSPLSRYLFIYVDRL